MKRITYEMLMAWEPCYEEARLTQYKGMACTAVEVLRMGSASINDRLWLVLREELLSAKDLRLFAVWCARRTLAREVKPSPLRVACVDMAERYALGTATFEEMQAARYDTRYAARYVDWDATRDATRNAAEEAARYAAWDAAWDATRNAAGYAAGDAERQAQIEELTAVFERSGL